MYQVAIVEDDNEAAAALTSALERYGSAREEQFSVTHFSAPDEFLMGEPRFDLIFMDIDMPGLDGMEAAGLLRAYDTETPLIFVTNLAQYALKGYEVDAMDFIVKPVSYGTFAVHMDKAMTRIRHASGETVVIGTKDGTRVASTRDVVYIEVSGHYLTYQLVDGPVRTRQTMSSAIESLPEGQFVRIANSCLANMAHIKAIRGEELQMSNGDVLYFSRPKRKEAMATISKYLGGSL